MTIDYRQQILDAVNRSESAYSAPAAKGNPDLDRAEKIRADRDRYVVFVQSLALNARDADPVLYEILMEFQEPRDLRDRLPLV